MWWLDDNYTLVLRARVLDEVGVPVRSDHHLGVLPLVGWGLECCWAVSCGSVRISGRSFCKHYPKPPSMVQRNTIMPLQVTNNQRCIKY